MRYKKEEGEGRGEESKGERNLHTVVYLPPFFILHSSPSLLLFFSSPHLQNITQNCSHWVVLPNKGAVGWKTSVNICTFFFLAEILLWKEPLQKGKVIWYMIACIYPCNWNNERWLLWANSHKLLVFLFNPTISCQEPHRNIGEDAPRISFASPQTVILFSFFFFPLQHWYKR